MNVRSQKKPIMIAKEEDARRRSTFYLVTTILPGDSSNSMCGSSDPVERLCRARRSAALLFVVSTERIDCSAAWQTYRKASTCVRIDSGHCIGDI